MNTSPHALWCPSYESKMDAECCCGWSRSKLYPSHSNWVTKEEVERLRGELLMTNADKMGLAAFIEELKVEVKKLKVDNKRLTQLLYGS